MRKLILLFLFASVAYSQLDPYTNFGSSILYSTMNSSTTTLKFRGGDRTKFPNPGVDGAFNVIVYNSTDYAHYALDPYVEIMRVTARGNVAAYDSFIVTRAQEGTSAVAHNKTGKTYTVFLTLTKRFVDSLAANLGGGGGSGWSLAGNSGTTAGTNFIGTTDSVDFVVKTNGQERSRIRGNGYTEFVKGINPLSPPFPEYNGLVTIRNNRNDIEGNPALLVSCIDTMAGDDNTAIDIYSSGHANIGLFSDASLLYPYDNLISGDYSIGIFGRARESEINIGILGLFYNNNGHGKTNIGVYGTVNNSFSNDSLGTWAGYFDGNTKTTGTSSVDSLYSTKGIKTDGNLTADTLFGVVSGSSGWSLTGNSGTNDYDNFVGTLDSQTVTVRSYDFWSGSTLELTPDGSFYIYNNNGHEYPERNKFYQISGWGDRWGKFGGITLSASNSSATMELLDTVITLKAKSYIFNNTISSPILSIDNSGNSTQSGTMNSDSAHVTNGGSFGGNVSATKFYVSTLNTAPTNAGDTGTAGEIRFASDGYLYLCTATNTWKRVQLSTW